MSIPSGRTQSGTRPNGCRWGNLQKQTGQLNGTKTPTLSRSTANASLAVIDCPVDGIASHTHGAHEAAPTAALRTNSASEAEIVPESLGSPHSTMRQVLSQGCPTVPFWAPSSQLSPASTKPSPHSGTPGTVVVVELVDVVVLVVDVTVVVVVDVVVDVDEVVVVTISHIPEAKLQNSPAAQLGAPVQTPSLQ